MEIWDLYNEKRELVGCDHVRGEKIPDGCYHLVVHVWIRNGNGEYLISQRSADRPSFPLMWECVGGSVTKGEDSITGALRETREEVGVTLNPENGTLLRSEYDGPVDLAQATTPEVAQAKWLTKAQIKELFDTGALVQTLEYFFDMTD